MDLILDTLHSILIRQFCRCKWTIGLFEEFDMDLDDVSFMCGKRCVVELNG